ncbi:MAG: hypothetical protein K0S71_1567 [Clostridia bacterium]|nr:hypothetical protein [Clostridia bacterium]
MLFLFDLPVNENPEIKEKSTKSISKTQLMIVIICIALVAILSISIVVFVKSRAPKNISPYCAFIKDQGRMCKIHNKKHSSKNVSEMIIEEEEMTLHQQLFEEISNGAYFDGEKLYKQEDAKEILIIKNTLNEEKESLFEGYLSSTLTKQEKDRYNFIIEELDLIQESIITLGIQETELQEPSKEDLIKEVETLKKELNEVRSEATLQTEIIEKEAEEPKQDKQDFVAKDTPQSSKISEDKMLYVSQSSKIKSIPKDIEKAATIKKSSLYN